MIEIKAPNKVNHFFDKSTFFLAGSIEMGSAKKWQDVVVGQVSYRDDIVLLNPRRDDWDSSWIQSIDNPQFNEQVNWELQNIEDADFVVFYFDPNTKSPITLMELGFVIGDRISREFNEIDTICVCCPKEFYRRGNVEIICARNGVKLVETRNIG